MLDGTDGSSSNAGDNILMEDDNRILQEDSSFVTRGLKDRVLLENSIGGVLFAESDRFAFPIGFTVSQGDGPQIVRFFPGFPEVQGTVRRL